MKSTQKLKAGVILSTIVLTFAAIFIILMLTSLMYINYMDATKACKDNAPSWAKNSFYIEMEERCVYESADNWREVNYRSESYYLIDNNHLGKAVK